MRWLSSAGRIFLGGHGEPVRGLGISLDVTERRSLEAQFQQAQKMEAVGRLAGGVAHDFNNLLTVILGFCELLLVDRDPDDPTRADMAEIEQAATRAAALTRQLYSEVGRGTAFKVYFPRASAAEMVAVSPAPPPRPRAATQTVLLVEDEDGVRELASRLLQRLGHTVLIAADANEAVRLFEENPSIDVLLTDVVMPGASGPELTGRLVEQRPALKVIYMSGYTEEAIVQHGVLKPGIAFLNKPFTSETLGRKLREVFER